MAKPSVESVFCSAADGGVGGSLQSPGVEGVQVLLAGSEVAVSIDAIREVYKEQEWDEMASLDLKQFTTLWTATVGDGSSLPASQREDSAVIRMTEGNRVDAATLPPNQWQAPAVGTGSGGVVGDCGGEGPGLEDEAMEAQVQQRLAQMWKDSLVQLPECVKALLPSEAFETFAKENRANARAHIAAAGQDKSKDGAIRGELKSMQESVLGDAPASVKGVPGPSVFHDFVTEKRSSVAERLEVQAKDSAEAVAFGKGSENAHVRSEPASSAAQSAHSVVGMRGVLQKRPLAKGNVDARAPVKVWNCHDLLSEPTGSGLHWRLTCTLVYAGAARNFTRRGAAAPFGGSSGGSPSPKKHRGEAEERDGVVIDGVLADNTGPLLATFWDDCAKQLQHWISEYGLGFTFWIEGFKTVALKEDDWNGKVCTRIHVLQSLPLLKGEASTFLKYAVDGEASTVNMTTAAYQLPPGPVFIENFAAARSFVSVPFRASLKGFVMDCAKDCSVSQNGNPLRLFSLMDRRGAFISCIAFDRHVDDETLSNGNEVMVYFGTGRAGIGNAPSAVYLYNDAVVVKCSNDVPRVWKQSLVDFAEKRP